MAILSITTDVTGQIGIIPQEIYIKTNDTLAVVTAAGYLNQSRTQGFQFSNLQLAHVYGTDFNDGEPGCLDFQVSTPSNPQTGDYSLVLTGANVSGPSTVNHIAVFKNAAGTLTEDTAVAINAGNIQAGVSGKAGHFIAYPSLPASGTLQLLAANNAGNTATVLTNAEMGQASTLTFQDPGVANANVAMAPAALVSGNLVQASGTVGLIADAGVAPAALQRIANIKAAVTANIGGSGAGPISVAVTGMTSSSVVTCTIASSSNAVQVEKAVAGSGSFSVTFSGDPGASCLLNYVAFIAAQ